jgi:two-component system nitrate/nitrite sensor histidine kinase NarX
MTASQAQPETRPHRPDPGPVRASLLSALWRPLTVPLLVLGVVVLLSVVVGLVALHGDAQSAVLVTMLVALLVAGIGTILLMLWRIRAHFLLPLAQLREWTRRIHDGDLGARVPLPRGGEFQRLAREINQLGADLQSLNHDLAEKVRDRTQHLSRKTRSLEILYEVAFGLNTSRNLNELLNQFLETFMELVDARAASVRLLTDDGKTRLVASRGLDPDVVARDTLTDVTRCQCGWAATDGGLRVETGARHCAQVIGRPYLGSDCSEFIAVPLQYQDRVLGVYNLFLNRPSADLGADVRDLLTSIGRHLGLAVEKARLDDQARRLEIFEERTMLGNELHDSLAQTLVSLRLNAKLLGELLHKKDLRAAQQEVQRLQSSVEEAHTNLRDLLANFRSRMDERGLAPAIAELVARFEAENGISAFFQNECTEINLSPAQEIQVFRIVQEALANIRKHADANNVRVLFQSEDGVNYRLIVEDDGTGIPPASPAQPGERVGLAIMHDRARRLQGTLLIESEPGEGTRLSLTFVGASRPAQPAPDSIPHARLAR